MHSLKETLDLIVQARIAAAASVGKCKKREEKMRLEFSTVQESYLATADEVKGLNQANEEMKLRRRAHIAEREAGKMQVRKVRETNKDLQAQLKAVKDATTAPNTPQKSGDGAATTGLVRSARCIGTSQHSGQIRRKSA